PSGWVQFPMPPNSESRGDVALGKNVVNVTAATNANPVVLTLNGPAPASGTSVTIAYTAPKPAPPTPSPWAALKGTFVATKISSNSCSIPVNSSTFGPYSPATSGTLAMTIPLPY